MEIYKLECGFLYPNIHPLTFKRGPLSRTCLFVCLPSWESARHAYEPTIIKNLLDFLNALAILIRQSVVGEKKERENSTGGGRVVAASLPEEEPPETHGPRTVRQHPGRFHLHSAVSRDDICIQVCPALDAASTNHFWSSAFTWSRHQSSRGNCITTSWHLHHHLLASSHATPASIHFL